MTLQEIFKTNPALLEAPEVKALIEHCKTGLNRIKEARRKDMANYDKTLELCINSEAFILGSTSYKDTVHAILKLHEAE